MAFGCKAPSLPEALKRSIDANIELETARYVNCKKLYSIEIKVSCCLETNKGK